MAITTKLLTGLIKGLGGPDLDELLEEMTKKAGEQVGAIIREMVTQSGNDLLESEEKVDQWIRENPDEAQAFTSVVVSKAALTQTSEEGSLIPDYLLALSVITSTIAGTKRSVYLRGFLHSDKCASYWELPPVGYGAAIGHFSKDPKIDQILPPRKPRVFILDGSPSNDLIHQVNLKIRKHEDKILEGSPHSSTKRITAIDEFKIRYAGLAEPDDVPLGAPGTIAMIESLDLAMIAQGEPKLKMTETIVKAKLTKKP